MGYPARDPLLRLMEKIEPNGDCWEWTAAKDRHGYGVFGWKGKVMRAHRAAYEILVGPFPEGMVSDHLCRNHACVNPDHIEPVTQRENMLRGFGVSGVAARKTLCVNGHPLDGRKLNKGHVTRYCKVCVHIRSLARNKKVST